jgi:hypothetical protein
VFALAVAGCSPSVIKINGKLVRNGAPMVVSEDTYVTVSFLPEVKEPDSLDAKSYSAKFDQKTGTYTVELPPGKYRTMVLVALPSKDESKVNMPTPPVKSQKVHELTRSQELDIEVPER